MSVGQMVIDGQIQTVYSVQRAIVIVMVVGMMVSVPPATEPNAASSSSIVPDGCAGKRALCTELRFDLYSASFHALITSK